MKLKLAWLFLALAIIFLIVVGIFTMIDYSHNRQEIAPLAPGDIFEDWGK